MTRRLLAALAILILGPGNTFAVPRACGPDAVANTITVLCAPPSGPCTAADVVLSANVEVAGGACVFDLGGRVLRVERSLQVGNGTIEVQNAGAITVTKTGKLKARGDFFQPAGHIVAGGFVTLYSSSSIAIAGTIDVSGDPAGMVVVGAPGDFTLESGATLRGDGITSFTEDGNRYSDAGQLEVFSYDGTIALDGDVTFAGTQYGFGGEVYLVAGRDVRITRRLDASGGEGGVIWTESGDSTAVTAPLIADSRGAGGFGGDILVTAGDDSLGGIAVGGDVVVDGAVVRADGSSADVFGGDGGTIFLAAFGDVTVGGAGALLRANAGTNFDGSGGTVALEARDHVTLNAPVVARSGSAGGNGGVLEAFAGGAVTVGAAADLAGRGTGGRVFAGAGGDVTLAGALDIRGTSATARGGSVTVYAGQTEPGTLALLANVVATGGSASTRVGSVTLAGCGLEVAPGVRIDGRTGGSAGGTRIQLVAREPMLLGAGSQYLATPLGRVVTTHPAGADPVIGRNVVFDPARIDDVSGVGPYPGCGLP